MINFSSYLIIRGFLTHEKTIIVIRFWYPLWLFHPLLTLKSCVNLVKSSGFLILLYYYFLFNSDLMYSSIPTGWAKSRKNLRSRFLNSRMMTNTPTYTAIPTKANPIK